MRRWAFDKGAVKKCPRHTEGPKWDLLIDGSFTKDPSFRITCENPPPNPTPKKPEPTTTTMKKDPPTTTMKKDPPTTTAGSVTISVVCIGSD